MKHLRTHETSAAALVLALGLMMAASREAQADPLPSWNDGHAKQSIIDFVARVTQKGSPDFVPPAANTRFSKS